MRSFFLLVQLMTSIIAAFAQTTFEDSILLHRQHYKLDFIQEARSPLKGNDTAFLRFFAPNKSYRVWAQLQLTPDAPIFEMQTYNGKKQQYRQFAIAQFRIRGKAMQLCIYQSQMLITKEEHKNHLFLPFNDRTNYESTYAGGRYIDLSLADIQGDKILIDFNKSYNPYCAYKEGYSCPIPPDDNRLKIRIEAGEQLFAGKVAE